MEFTIVQKTYKKDEKGELALISTLKRSHTMILHANFDAKEMANKLAKRKDLDDWSVEIFDQDGDKYTMISPTVGDKCYAFFVFAMMHELEQFNRITKEMLLEITGSMIQDLADQLLDEE